jgi:phosphocarrier protein HPr
LRVEEKRMIIEKTVTIKNKQGLHARPAALFVQIANKFNSVITITKGRHKVNGKSIMGIMMLEAGYGSKVTMTVNGDDAERAVKELEVLLLSENIDELVL